MIVEDFLAFVKAQPDDRNVDHGGGWNSCACSDFGKSLPTMKRSGDWVADALHSDVGSNPDWQVARYNQTCHGYPIPDELVPTVWDKLNNAYALGAGSTYGELKTFLNLKD